MFLRKGRVKLIWSSNFAYAIGLIASDGCLTTTGRHVLLKSADLELVENFKSALNVKNDIKQTFKFARKYFHINVGDIAFYEFLNSIGLHRAKSKTIQSVDIPEDFFADFLRGLFDGDGTFYTFWDKRWPNSFGYQISFTSASPNFMLWLKDKLTSLCGVKGFIVKGDGVFNLRYVKRDSRRLFEVMYYSNNLLFLNRKYVKIKEAFKKDIDLHLKTELKSVII